MSFSILQVLLLLLPHYHAKHQFSICIIACVKLLACDAPRSEKHAYMRSGSVNVNINGNHCQQQPSAVTAIATATTTNTQHRSVSLVNCNRASSSQTFFVFTWFYLVATPLDIAECGIQCHCFKWYDMKCNTHIEISTYKGIRHVI